MWWSRRHESGEFSPEISANKYALNLRCPVFGDDVRPHTISSNVEFELALCNL